jgi:hypothetical protein
MNEGSPPALRYARLFKSYFLIDVCNIIDCIGNDGNTLYLPVRFSLPSSGWESVTWNKNKRNNNIKMKEALLIRSLCLLNRIFIYVCMLHVQCASIYMHKDILKLECMGGYLLYLSKKNWILIVFIGFLQIIKVVQNGQYGNDTRTKIFQWYWRFWIAVLKKPVILSVQRFLLLSEKLFWTQYEILFLKKKTFHYIAFFFLASKA